MENSCPHAIDIKQPDAVQCRAKAFENNGRTILPISRIEQCAVCTITPGAVTLVQLSTSKCWPKWASSLRAVAIPADVGAGDTAAREIAAVGLVGFQVKYNVNFGPSCGCGAKEWSEDTRGKWNERWKYS